MAAEPGGVAVGAGSAMPHDLARALGSGRDRHGSAHDVRWFATVGSTNDVARALVGSDGGHGLVVVADEQTAGRGRRGRRWASPGGAGLYMSQVVGLPGGGVTASAPGLVTLGVGVAMVEAIRVAAGVDVHLKWPNDLVIERGDGRPKLGGILVERVAGQASAALAVVGIGVNLRHAGIPADLARSTTSLDALGADAADRGELLAAAVERIDAVLAELARESGADVLRRWERASPSCRGVGVRWTDGDAGCRGVTDGVDPDGALRVRTAGGVGRIVSSEVVWS